MFPPYAPVFIGLKKSVREHLCGEDERAACGEGFVRRYAGDCFVTILRCASVPRSEGSFGYYSIAPPCVHLAAHAAPCVRGRAVRIDAQLCRPHDNIRLVLSYTTPPVTARLSEVMSQRLRSALQSRNIRRASSPWLRSQKKQTGGPNRLSACGAKRSRGYRTEWGDTEIGASKPRDFGCALCLPVCDAGAFSVPIESERKRLWFNASRRCPGGRRDEQLRNGFVSPSRSS
jgi:hypothetical protein